MCLMFFKASFSSPKTPLINFPIMNFNNRNVVINLNKRSFNESPLCLNPRNANPSINQSGLLLTPIVMRLDGIQVRHKRKIEF